MSFYIWFVFLPSIGIAAFVVMFCSIYQRIKEIHQKLFPEQYEKQEEKP